MNRTFPSTCYFSTNHPRPFPVQIHNSAVISILELNKKRNPGLNKSARVTPQVMDRTETFPPMWMNISPCPWEALPESSGSQTTGTMCPSVYVLWSAQQSICLLTVLMELIPHGERQIYPEDQGQGLWSQTDQGSVSAFASSLPTGQTSKPLKKKKSGANHS